MAGIPDPTDPVWDQFFEFLEPHDVPDTGAAADAVLRKHGINPSKTQARVLDLVKRARAEAELAAAKQRVTAFQEKHAVVPSSVEQMSRDRVRQLIAERCDEPTQQAYFRKLDAAATDADLRAVLDDLERLKRIAEEEANGGKPGEQTSG